MSRKNRRFSTFNLSFLDIMSCGFGAVALIFLMIKHGADNQVDRPSLELMAEANLLNEEILDGDKQLVDIQNTLSDLDQRLAEAQGLARRINDNVLALRNRVTILSQDNTDQQIKDLEEQLNDARVERERLAQQERERGSDARRFMGQGQRQYLTGLKLGGARILILVDASASMLDETIVNVIRRRNMSAAARQSAPKWLRAVNTVQWLVAQLPTQSRYQIYTFNTKPTSVIPDSEGTWLSISDRNQLENAVQNLSLISPEKGTSLANVFTSIYQFEERPDNIYLITDGLPTQGEQTPNKNTVSGKERLKLFRDAAETLPMGVPVNIVLLPMEGDWMAAAEYWKLGQITGGSFLSPSKDWP
ncbi:vWA domain-containing protein [Aurantivibrio plasticivorans]